MCLLENCHNLAASEPRVRRKLSLINECFTGFGVLWQQGSLGTRKLSGNHGSFTNVSAAREPRGQNSDRKVQATGQLSSNYFLTYILKRIIVRSPVG